ncbi:KOW motif-containing protein [Herbaspirillum huttiense]|uniref:KOW motif-containing protein n=2 Tax=Herbaspirillum huttiense TaxID=863372 RepID=A0AAJ2HFC9_9BURK|nr:KOW motif-containing protein [Herbaspirillum huttiense]MDR9839427.1 KOW motif-containing protein [Herbaspirillum huttiense]
MNCKPGDLAIIIAGEFSGLIVKVIEVAPVVRFSLPDGRPHEPCSIGDWIVKLPRMLNCPTKRGNTIPSEWAACPDSKLCPVSGLPMEEETEQKLKEPA